MEELLKLDREVFSYLYGLGSEPYDQFWLIITKQIYWALFFIAVFYLLQKKVGWKNFGIIILFLALLITFTDQFTNLVKNNFQRLRPCNAPELSSIMRDVIKRSSFSFFSGHASNSMASTTFIFLILRKYYKHTYLLYFFPLLFAYSRIYLGLHYPGDILTGYFFGAIFGITFYKLYSMFTEKYNDKSVIKHE